MEKKQVVIVSPIHPDGLAVLAARGDVDVTVLDKPDPAGAAGLIAGAHGILVRNEPLGADVLAGANGLQVVSKHGVGCDNIGVDHMTARGLPVAIAADANSLSVAEHTMMMMLAISKQAVFYDNAARTGRYWERGKHRTFELAGRTLLIVGYGRIGRRLAPLARAFGMRVLVSDIAMDFERARAAGCEVVDDWRAVLGEVDVLTVHVPLYDATRHMVGVAELAALPDHSVVINNARGGIVDEAALAKALADGAIAGAGTDVFSVEPPPVDNPLLTAPNLLLTPHSAAVTDEGKRAMSVSAAENILSAFDGTLADGFIFNAEGLKAKEPA